MAVRLIIGLGNPGKEYAGTRHNIGATLIEEFVASAGTYFKAESKFKAQVAKLADSNCIMAIPSTFMNNSGQTVQALKNFYKLTPEEILIVHDELDLPVGLLRLKQNGGHGGHNGLRDITEKLGGGDYLRLRVGIGHPGQSSKVTGHVLSRPGAAEQVELDISVNEGLKVLKQILQPDASLEKIMNELHTEK